MAWGGCLLVFCVALPKYLSQFSKNPWGFLTNSKILEISFNISLNAGNRQVVASNATLRNSPNGLQRRLQQKPRKRQRKHKRNLLKKKAAFQANGLRLKKPNWSCQKTILDLKTNCLMTSSWLKANWIRKRKRFSISLLHLVLTSNL